MAVSDYSTTPADNTSISGLTVSDSTVANTLDNIIRQMMADIKAADDANAKLANYAIPGNVTRGLHFIETFSFSNTASKLFSGFDAASYDWYEFVFLNVVPATDGADLRLRTSTDGGSTIDTSSGDYFSSTSPGTMTTGTSVILASSVGSDTGEWGFSGRLRLYGPHIAAKTQMTFEGTFQNAAGAYQAVSGSGVRTAVADVDAVQISFSTGNLESGTCIMFGGRNA